MSETIQTKRCSKCKEIKAASEFYKTPTTRGYSYWCKECFHIKKTSPQGREEAMRYFRSEKGQISYARNRKKYVKTEKYKKACCKHANKYRLNNLEKVKAQHIIFNAVRYGKLPKPSTQKCKSCGKKAHDYHHHIDYKPVHWFDVVPLCKLCHLRIHGIAG